MKKRKRNKKKTFLKFLIVFLIFITLSILIYIYLKKDTLEYKTKLTIEVGESVPTVKEY